MGYDALVKETVDEGEGEGNKEKGAGIFVLEGQNTASE